jgi:membrane protease YdiL (CAAX protease family)
MDIKHSQLNPGLQLVILILILIAAMFMGTLIGVAVALAITGMDAIKQITQMQFNSPQVHNALWIIQLCGTTLPLFLTPVFFSYVIVRDPDDYLKPHFEFTPLLLLIVLALAFFSNPLLEVLSNINQKMQLPHALQGVQKWMRDSEDENEKVSNAMMLMPTVTSLIGVVLFVGLLTAIVEEFMFRGCMQTVLFNWTKSNHAAIWITATLFSAFHLEFFGFLPRLMLGVFFGYFVAWSGSVWTSVWAHFVNNATAVIATYLFQHKMIAYNPDEAHRFNYAVFAFSLLITLLLLFIYRSITLRQAQPIED